MWSLWEYGSGSKKDDDPFLIFAVGDHITWRDEKLSLIEGNPDGRLVVAKVIPVPKLDAHCTCNSSSAYPLHHPMCRCEIRRILGEYGRVGHPQWLHVTDKNGRLIQDGGRPRKYSGLLFVPWRSRPIGW